MPRLLPAAILIIVVTLFGYCKKDAAKNAEAIFYGVWVNPIHGDTLHFYKKGIKNILRSNQSFNVDHYVPHEQEFRYVDGKLHLTFGVGTGNFYPLEDFKWQVIGQRFEFRAYRVYMFMSSSIAIFSYVKVS